MECRFLFVLLMSTFIGFTSCKPTESKLKSENVEINDSDNQKMLNNFYREYLQTISEIPLNLEKINKLKREYCTIELLQKLEKNELDFDPFINGQDIPENWNTTFKISKKMNSEGWYIVSLDDVQKVNVKVQVHKNKIADLEF